MGFSTVGEGVLSALALLGIAIVTVAVLRTLLRDQAEDPTE